MILDDLRQRDQASLEGMGVGNGNVANVPRGQRRPLGGVARVDLVRGRADLHFFANFLLMVQHQRQLVASGMQRDGLAREQEKTFLARLRLVVTGRKIMESEAPGGIALRTVGMPRGIFERYFGGWDRDAILVDNDSRAIGELRSTNLGAGKDTRESDDPDRQPNQPHRIPSPSSHR